jgi:hypothetical protein
MAPNEVQPVEGRRLGRLPHKSTRSVLSFASFFQFLSVPEKTNYWINKSKKPLPRRTFGNDRYGNCTRAKQAYASIRMERLEQKRTIDFTDDEIIRVYEEMSNRRYGGGDNGAYEDDALNDWRNPDYAARDTKGNPYTIAAYLKIAASNQKELKAGLALSPAHVLPFCLNLPAAWQDMDDWDVPEGQPLVGPWMPGSWGGHSMNGIDYDKGWWYTDDTWAFGVRKISWAGMAAYCDEAHLILDSVNAFKKRLKTLPASFESAVETRGIIDDIVDAVNNVSSLKIKV